MAQPQSLAGFLSQSAAAATVLHYGTETITVRELDGLSRRAASSLAELGIGYGDRVALWLPNIPAWFVLFFACARLGAIAVAVNTRFRSHELQDIVARSGCKALVVWPGFKQIDFLGILREIDPAALRSLEHIIVYKENNHENEAASADWAISDTILRDYQNLLQAAPYQADHGGSDVRCVIFTTSGTTKAPKFVCHHQAAVIGHAHDVADSFALWMPGTKLLQALPLCGVFGFSQAMAGLAAAVPMTLLPLFDAEQAVTIVREQGITQFCGVDDMMDRMLAVTNEPRPFPGLRWFGYARFNPALEDIVEHAAERGVTLRGLYGMSEVHALFSIQPEDAVLSECKKAGGYPVCPEAKVRVRDPESREVLASGESGEIEIKTLTVMAEYFGDPVATIAAFTEDGYFKTGDLGHMEADGRFCYVTRMGDVLRLGGFLTSPLEIEAVIDNCPGVSSSQVVAVPIDGQPTAVAFAVLESEHPLDENIIRDECKVRLAGYKVPKRVFAIDAFPVTQSANGSKIQRGVLRERALRLLQSAT